MWNTTPSSEAPNWSTSPSVSGSYSYLSDKQPTGCGCGGNLEAHLSDYMIQTGLVEWECEKCGQSFIKKRG